jgi:NADH dehydrogenase
MRIVVLGGGFGGVATVRHLEKVLRRRTDVELTLVSRENFFVLTPLLFEACSGRLELRHCAQPIRAALQRTRFNEATVESVDLER